MAASRTAAFSIKGFENSLNRGKPAPVYLLYGSDGHRMKQAAQVVKERILKEADQETAWRVYDLAQAEFVSLLDDCRTVSFFGGLRGVVAVNFAIKGGKTDDDGEEAAENRRSAGYALDEEDQKQLMRYVESPSPDVALLLMAEKVNLKYKFWKELAAKTEAIAFTEPKEHEKKRIVADMLAESGLKFDTEAWKWITENFAHNYTQLETEIIKLDIYTGGKKKVSLADLEECMNAPRSDSVFKLAEAIAHGRIDVSLGLLKTLKNQGEILVKVMGLIARQFRILLILKSLVGQNLSEGEKARLSRVSPYFLGNYENQAKKFTLVRLKKIIQLLSSTDIGIKRSSLNGWMILEETVISIINGQKNVAA